MRHVRTKVPTAIFAFSEGETIMQGYCVKCKASREMKDLTYTKAANGRTMAKGTCPVCGTKMNKFLSKEEAEKHGAKKK
jgi:DNA repair exonuclease SbcCD ATPase subunit